MSCLKCLKYTMCAVNFIFFLCGAAIFGLGIYMSTTSKYLPLFPSFSVVNLASALFVIGIFVTCVSFLGFLGALKENRCLLMSFFSLLFLLMLSELAVACLLLLYEHEIDKFIQDELKASLNQTLAGETINSTIDWEIIQKTFKCCGVNNYTDWNPKIPGACCETPPCQGKAWTTGCYSKLKQWFESNLLGTGIGVIIVCSIEVLAMCFSMTLFCHITKSGLGYK
ncbi:leukocyte surface antigen CD53 [Clarias gariepinus]|uniref:leukocyte surface antigen CD53 n=1 Tax=Clarias gariepinus TaxID=13013 RepID=UPI00234D089F|nr:leukocyte surface antigen CD53 [Clarias gariepinus]